VLRSPGAPSTLLVRADVRDGDRVACSAAGAVEQWVGVEEGLRDRLRQSPDEPRLRWAIQRGVARDLHVGGVALNPAHCRPEDVPESAVLAIRDGEPAERPVPFPWAAFAEAHRRDDAARQGVRSLQARHEDDGLARSEQQWRDAFRRAREAVAALEETRDRLRQKASSASLTSREQAQLAEAESRLPRAREQLDELERRASFQGVPRPWRQ